MIIILGIAHCHKFFETVFQKLDLFLSLDSGEEGSYSLEPLDRASLDSSLLLTYLSLQDMH
jgi:hypothetical protein